MIDVAELRSLIKHDEQPLTDIEKIFCALVSYPGGEEILDSTRADRTGAFRAACVSLIGVGDTVPTAVFEIIAERLKSVTKESIAGQSYGSAVALIRANIDPFLLVLRA